MYSVYSVKLITSEQCAQDRFIHQNLLVLCLLLATSQWGCCSSQGGSPGKDSFNGVFNSQLFSPAHIIIHRLSPHSAKTSSPALFSAFAPQPLGFPFYFFITSRFEEFMWLFFLLFQTYPDLQCNYQWNSPGPSYFAISWFSYRTALGWRLLAA